MVGLMFGSSAAGFISDGYGRRLVYISLNMGWSISLCTALRNHMRLVFEEMSSWCTFNNISRDEDNQIYI